MSVCVSVRHPKGTLYREVDREDYLVIAVENESIREKLADKVRSVLKKYGVFSTFYGCFIYPNGFNFFGLQKHSLSIKLQLTGEEKDIASACKELGFKGSDMQECALSKFLESLKKEEKQKSLLGASSTDISIIDLLIKVCSERLFVAIIACWVFNKIFTFFWRD